MTDPNKLLAEIREQLQRHLVISQLPSAADHAIARQRVFEAYMLLAGMADKFTKLDHALTNGMYYPDDWNQHKRGGPSYDE